MTNGILLLNGVKNVDKNDLAPVVAFAYNRVDKIRNCLESLEKNVWCDCTKLYIFSDGPKVDGDVKVIQTRKYLKSYVERSAFASCELIEAPYNKGLANSIIDGVTKIVNQYGKVIVVEDDLLFHDHFLMFMNKALDFYKKDGSIGAINGYTYPIEKLNRYGKYVYMLEKGDCWGWATWADRWSNAVWASVDFKEYLDNGKLRKNFEKLEYGWDNLMVAQMNGLVDSWAIRWVYYLWQNKLYSIYPRDSYVSNVGFDASGTHCNSSNTGNEYRSRLKHDNSEIDDLENDNYFCNVSIDKKIARLASKYPARNCSKYALIKSKIYNIIKMKRGKSDYADFSK